MPAIPDAEGRSFRLCLIHYLFSVPVVPAAPEFGSWLETMGPWGNAPADLPLMIERLKRWDPSKPYPPLPDNESLEQGVYRNDPRWWVPGTEPGPVLGLINP